MEINIAPQSVSGECDLKCAYNCKYAPSNSTLTNNLYFLSLSYDQQKESPVTYNGAKYNVSAVKLYKPSLHKYLGKKMDAELIIEHNPVNGGEMLRVCLPISTATGSNETLTNLVKSASSSAPGKGDKTKISDVSLQSLIPNKQFYSYQNNGASLSGDYIVFGSLSALSLSQTTLATLGKIIQPFEIAMKGDNLFLNKNGPNSSKETVDGDGIYIDCQPTGTSEETVDIVNDVSRIDIFDDPNVLYAIKLIMSCILFIVFFVAFNMFYNKYLAKTVAINSTK
jgi:carbonic anhydrase